MPLDLKLVHLRALIAVARLHSYARAAEELSYTEPAVLLQIRSLEKALGLTLVRRERKQVALTSAGEQIARAAVDALDQATKLRQVARGLQGRIVVATETTAAVTWVMPLVAQHQALHPNQVVELHTEQSSGLVAGVADGLYDIAIGGFSAAQARGTRFAAHRLVLVPWVRDEWWLAAPGPILKGSSGPVFDLGRLGSTVRVFCQRSQTLWQPEELESFLFERLGRPVQIVLEDGLELVHGAVINGLGFGILPYSMIHFAAGQQIVPLFALGEWQTLMLRLLHRRARLLTPTARNFLSFLIANRQSTIRRPSAATGRITAFRSKHAG